MKFHITHRLDLTAALTPAHAVRHLLLTPPSGRSQTVSDWTIEGDGSETATGFVDAFGNAAHLLTLVRPGATTSLTASGTVETMRDDGVVGMLPGEVVAGLFRRVTPQTRVAAALTARFRGERKSQDRLEMLHQLMAHVGTTLAERAEEDTPPEPSDYAHGFVGAARALDIPARYVTGYLAGGAAEDGPEEAGVHAWAEALVDGLGWVGFDAAHNQCPTEGYVRVAQGLDAATAPMVRAYPVLDAMTQSLSMSPTAPIAQEQSQDGQSQSQSQIRRM